MERYLNIKNRGDNMLGIGETGIIALALVLLLLFGSGKLADWGKAIGKFKREMRKAEEDE